jgi:parallel beta-helix repeat protein
MKVVLRRMLLPALAMLALVAMLAFVFLLSSRASATCIVPPTGDWNIQSGDICINSGIILRSGDVHIQNGGKLNLTGGTLRMDSTYPGEFLIEVQGGGTFDINSGANITAGDPRYNYKFLVRSGATLYVDHSTVSHVGFDAVSDDDLGLRVETNSVTITHSTFKESFTGLYIKGVSPKVTNSTFQYNHFGVLCTGGSGLGFYDNKVLFNSVGLSCTDSKPDIAKNLFSGNDEEGIYLLRSDAKIFGNRINSNLYGIGAIHSSPKITHNNISFNTDGIRAFFGSPTITDNELWVDNRSSMYLVHTAGSVSNNKVSGDPSGYPLVFYGIFLQQSTTSVTNNTLLNISVYALWIDGGSKVHVYDNHVLYISGTGIQIINSWVDLRNNEIKNNYYGMYLSSVSGTVKGNTIYNNTYGIDIYASNASLDIEANTFTKNTKLGLVMEESSVLVRGNTFDANPVSISSNRSTPRVLGNTIKDSQKGVEIAGYSVLYFANNTVLGGNYTVYSIKSRSALYNNTISNSWNYSVYLCKNSYSLMVGNRLSGESKGVYILDSDADIYDNDIKDARVGIYAELSNIKMVNNTFHDNDIGFMATSSTVSMEGGSIHDESTYAVFVMRVELTMKDVYITGASDGVHVSDPSTVLLTNVTITEGKTGLSAAFGAKVHLDSSRITHMSGDGLYLVDVPITITNSMVAYTKNGIRAYGSSISATDTYFGQAETGILVDDIGSGLPKTIILSECSITGANYSGIKAFDAEITIKNSVVSQNKNGMLLQNGSLTMTDSHILENTDMGVRVNSTKVIVRDTQFIGNMDGLFDLGDSIIDLFDCNMSSNEVFGLYSDDSTLYSNITITRRVIMQDNTLMVRGHVFVLEDGHLLLLRAPLELYSVIAGEAGVVVQKGGSFEMVEALIYAYLPDQGYTFLAEENSGLTMVNSTVRNCGIGVIPMEDGFVIKTRYAKLHDVRFDNNSVGLYVLGTVFNGTGLRFTNNKIGVLAQTSDLYLINCSFSGSKEKDIVITHSTVKVLNSQVAFTKVELKDTWSLFQVLWYLHVSVTWNDGQPDLGAQISVTDKALKVLTAKTDNQGYAMWLIVREYQQEGPSPGGYYAFSPLTFNATDLGITVIKTQYISATTTVELVLIDKTPPTVVILAPVNGSIAYTNNLMVLGTATDDASGPIDVELSVDGTSWVPASGSSSWSATLGITQGAHMILVRAKDAHNNIGLSSINIEIDLTSPSLVVYSPQDGAVTNQSLIHVSGRVHVGSGVIIDGQTVTVSLNGTFDKAVLLVEGPNVIHIKVLKGLETINANMTVVLDTRPPQIFLKHPTKGAILNVTFVTITVYSDEEASFYLAGQSVQAFGGEANLGLTLAEGSNKVHVKAIDKAGNVNETDYTVIIDITRPQLTIESPKAPVFSTTKGTLQVLGKTEPGATLTVDGKPMTTQLGGQFTFKQKLKLGKNEIHIVSVDKAGNRNEIVLLVKRTQSVDMVRYYLALIVGVIAVVVADVSVFLYFSRYYRPPGSVKAGPDKGPTDEDRSSEVEENERKRPRQPSVEPPVAGETEFEEVSFEELPPD